MDYILSLIKLAKSENNSVMLLIARELCNGLMTDTEFEAMAKNA